MRSTYSLVLILALASLVRDANAKSKDPKPPAQDEIQVIAQIPSGGNSLVRFLTTHHYRRTYLYAEEQSGHAVTLIDITNITHPAVIGRMSDPAGPANNLVAVTGDAALFTVGNSAANDQLHPQTFRIMSFADPLHPVIKREFTGITASARDDKRGLIFLADANSIWILQQQFAPDPESEKQWEHMMLDAR